jgi:hypothetical protein
VAGADACPTVSGLIDRQGCPIGGATESTLHTVDQAGTGACGTKKACKGSVEGAEIRVFDRADAAFVAAHGTNPKSSDYPTIFEDPSATGQIAACTTDAAGECTAGQEATGEYLVIAKFVDSSGATVYTGRKLDPSDFDANDLANLQFHVIKFIKKNGNVQFSGGQVTVVNGSYLEIVYPDEAVWDDANSGYVYPFIFTSDSTWDVDVCAEVLEGYEIVGVYDADGNLVSTQECVQTLVANETVVVAFDVIEVGSPEPLLSAAFSVTHNGTVTDVDIEVPGYRTYIENSSWTESVLLWSLLAAAAAGFVMLTGFAVWRRRVS